MKKRILWILIPALLSLTIGLIPSNGVSAHPAPVPHFASAFDLIVAVNDLRASYGFPAYNVSSILMSTAQGQADFMASTGTVTHSGPGGISLTQRLQNAGYSLAGGFRAENILSTSSNASGYEIVNSGYWADADHQNTMLSANLTEIGAGVAVRGGTGYYVIDCAQPSTGGGASSGGATVNGTPANKGPSQILSAVVLSTPREDGAIYHDVQYGQSLWSIAIAYGTKIDEIKRLNNLTSNDIYLGQKLLIANVGTATPTIPAVTQTQAPQKTSTSLPTLITTETVVVTATSTLSSDSQTSTNNSGGVLIGIIIAIALLAAGIGTWLGTKRPV